MSVRKINFPRSFQQDQRPVHREQHDFSGGMSYDFPASTLPLNAVQELIDCINYANRIKGRGGSKMWSTIQPPVLRAYPAVGTALQSWTILGTVRTIDCATAIYDVGLAGQWVVINGIHERVLESFSPTSIRTRTAQPEGSGSVLSLTSHGHPHGALWHEGMAIGIVQFGTIFYTFDRFITAYTPVQCVSTEQPLEARAFFQIYKQKFIAFGGGSIFIINVDDKPTYAWKLNTACPTIRIPDVVVSTIYGYHVTYTMTRLSGNGPRNRDTAGVRIEAESGPVKWQGSVPDYGSQWYTKPIDIDQPLATPPTFSVTSRGSRCYNSLTNPSLIENPNARERKWTHYSIHRTIDLGYGTTAAPKAPGETNLFYWVEDVPIMRPMVVDIAADIPRHTDVMTISGGFQGFFTQGDVGSKVYIHDGANNGNIIGSYLITSFISTTTVYVTGSHAPSVGPLIGEIGRCSKAFMAKQAGTLITSTYGNPFTVEDVGRRINRDDGTETTIVSFVDSNNVNVDISETRDLFFAGCTDPSTRAYFDTTKDHILAPDIVTYGAAPADANHLQWPLRSRLWVEFPVVDQGVLAPGWMVGIASGDIHGYYSMVNDLVEKHLGYYVPDEQIFTIEDQPIVRVSKMINVVMVYCRSRASALQLSSTANNADSKTQMVVSVISQILPVSETIGLLDQDSVIANVDGSDICICSDFGLRVCDGAQFGNNLFTDHIQTLIWLMHNDFALHVDTINGMIVWGGQNSLVLPPSTEVPPTIVTPPVYQFVTEGDTATFFIVASGSGLTYQWTKRVGDLWVDISGATLASYTTDPTDAADDRGEYRVNVRNAGGAIRSYLAKLSVFVPIPVITTPPSPQTVVEGSTATFTIAATGTHLTYQWYRDGVAIVGATAATYSIGTTLSSDDAGLYTCTVTNPGGSVTSTGALLTVVTTPIILSSPSDTTVIVRQLAFFIVVASGHGLSYQWYRNASPMGGETANSLTILITAASDNLDSFHCVVTNAAGSVTSANALLTLLGEVAGCTDFDGNSYDTIVVGKQEWLNRNLEVTNFNDGSPIPQVTSDGAWAALSTPGYCWYVNDPVSQTGVYGAMYNWFAVSTDLLAPTGWHVATDAEFTSLVTFLGGHAVAGGKLKESGTAHWPSPNVGATNAVGFTWLPGGDRDGNDGTFHNQPIVGAFWNRDSFDSTQARLGDVAQYTASAFFDVALKTFGYNIRCVKD